MDPEELSDVSEGSPLTPGGRTKVKHNGHLPEDEQRNPAENSPQWSPSNQAKYSSGGREEDSGPADPSDSVSAESTGVRPKSNIMDMAELKPLLPLSEEPTSSSDGSAHTNTNGELLSGSGLGEVFPRDVPRPSTPEQDREEEESLTDSVLRELSKASLPLSATTSNITDFPESRSGGRGDDDGDEGPENGSLSSPQIPARQKLVTSSSVQTTPPRPRPAPRRAEKAQQTSPAASEVTDEVTEVTHDRPSRKAKVTVAGFGPLPPGNDERRGGERSSSSDDDDIPPSVVSEEEAPLLSQCPVVTSGLPSDHDDSTHVATTPQQNGSTLLPTLTTHNKHYRPLSERPTELKLKPNNDLIKQKNGFNVIGSGRFGDHEALLFIDSPLREDMEVEDNIRSGKKYTISDPNAGKNGIVEPVGNGHIVKSVDSVDKTNGLHTDKGLPNGDTVEEEDHDGGACGWGRCQPSCCQRFRDARWYLVIITLCGAVQGMAINGFVNTVISTIERRFEISSTESGLIASCYDIMFVLLVIPISYFGGNGNKPRYLGIGIFILGLGSFVFSLPHFLTENYVVGSAQETVCLPASNTSANTCTSGDSGLSNYKYLFFAGQLLHGAGATALYTLGVTYMDENVPQRLSSYYNGIFYTGAIIGPAVGYMLGSELLNIYTDIGVDPASLGLDNQNPRWVGAWWIGFLFSGTIGVLLSLPLLAFPQHLPGAKQYAAERGQEAHARSKTDRTGQSKGLKDILLSIRLLLTNLPFMLIGIAAAADGILIAGFSTFMPKFIEYQFGITAGKAALFVGLAVVPAGGGATFAGGFLVRYFNLKVRGILRLCIVSSVLLCVLSIAMLIECDTSPFAGVSIPYGETNTQGASFLGQKNLDSSCNAGCNCAEEDYYPMCGRDGVLYFSPCYAGCTDVVQDGDIKPLIQKQLEQVKGIMQTLALQKVFKDADKRYMNCSCVSYNLTAADLAVGGDNTHGQFGKCDNPCHWLPVFMVLFGFMIVLVFLASMPSLAVTLRCVPDHQRSFGLGIQWIVARCLGSIPGPILFGKMFDVACLVWQKRCDGEGSCFFYDNHEMSVNILILAIIFSFAAAAAFILAYLFYKVKPKDDSVCMEPVTPTSQTSRTTLTTVAGDELQTPSVDL